MALLFPPHCAACKGSLLRAESGICTHCRYHLPRTHYLAEPDNPVAQRFWGKVPLVHATAYLKFIKNGRTQNLLYALKYYHQPELGRQVGHWFGLALRQHFGAVFEVVVPVPLHPRRQRQRGYNQSEYIAQGIGMALDVPWANALRRVQFAQSQTRLSRWARWQNVATVFEVAEAAPIAGRHVLLVDDVVTTGATLEASAHQLYAGGAAAVSIAALAAP